MYRALLLACLFTANVVGAEAKRDIANIYVGDILPQIAVGGAWSTEIHLMNTRFVDEDQAFTLRFMDETGAAMAVPVVGLGMQTSVSGTVGPRGVAFFELSGGPNTLVGFAVAESTSPGGVAMNAVLTQKVEGRPDFQASVPSTDQFGSNFQFPYRNDGPYTTTIAFVSHDDQPVVLVARDSNGTEICNTTRQMTVGQHVSFLVSDPGWLTCTAGQRGVIEIVPAEGSTGSAIAFLFNDQGAFTTVLPFEIDPDEQ